jgi:xylan 1,4-beta-xylosidase
LFCIVGGSYAIRAVGYATAASPLGPWKKYAANPVISRHNIGFNGTGHGDMFIDKKGSMYYVMHTHRSEEHVSPRATAMLRLRFSSVKGGPDVLTADTATFRWLKAE